MPTYINRFLKLILAVALTVAILSFAFLTFYGLFPVKYNESITVCCKEYGVDKNLVFALIKAESNFDADAVSDASAKGLMQLTDETFSFCKEQIGIQDDNADIYDAETNLRAGVWYLSFLLKKYDGNIENAVAAYNAGASNVDKWLASSEHSPDGKTLESIPFGETQRHVEKIVRYRKIYSILY